MQNLQTRGVSVSHGFIVSPPVRGCNVGSHSWVASSWSWMRGLYLWNLLLFQYKPYHNQKQIQCVSSASRGNIFQVFPLNPCTVLLLLNQGCCTVGLCWFHIFVIYTCRTIPAASIFYLEHLFFISRERCVTQRYYCFGSVEVFGENITWHPLTCIWLAEGFGCGNRLIFILGLSCWALLWL